MVPSVKKYGLLVRAFLVAVDFDSGALGVLPYSGGLMEQPHRTMDVIELIQGVFREKIRDEVEKAKHKRG